MMGQVQPETTAIQLYDWIIYQRGLKIALDAVSDAQAAINPAYRFRVEKNMYAPAIQDIQNQALVNILIDGYDPENYTASTTNHSVTFFIDCYVLGRNENSVDNPGSLLPADQVAVERLQYLCAQVEYGIRNMSNYYMSLDPGNIRQHNLGLKFTNPQDVEDAAEPYAPARFTLTCTFGYNCHDDQGVDISETLTTVGEWASRFIY